MENLTDKITNLLSDPEMLSKIKNISGLLGNEESNNKNENNENNENKDENSKEQKNKDTFSFSPEIMQMVLKLMPILTSIKKEDKYTKFIQALKPLLSEKKQKKLDSSSNILKVMRILPLLKNQGILWGEKN